MSKYTPERKSPRSPDEVLELEKVLPEAAGDHLAVAGVPDLLAAE